MLQAFTSLLTIPTSQNRLDRHSCSHRRVKWKTLGPFVCTSCARVKLLEVQYSFGVFWILKQHRCSLWRQESGRNTQAGESWPIPTVVNYTSFSLCLQGQNDTAFSQFATLSLNRCQSEQNIILPLTGLKNLP